MRYNYEYQYAASFVGGVKGILGFVCSEIKHRIKGTADMNHFLEIFK